MQQSSDAMTWSEGAAALLTFGILMFLEWSKISNRAPYMVSTSLLQAAHTPRRAYGSTLVIIFVTYVAA
jgi:hypothetical protein